MFLYSYWFSTSPSIVLFSLVLLFIAVWGAKKLSLGGGKIKKYIIFSSVLAVLFLIVSLLYTERKFGGTVYWYYHGLPHFYLLENRPFGGMDEVAGLVSSSNIFMENNLQKIASGVISLYLTVNFIFWFSISFCLLEFADLLKKLNSKR